MTSKTKGRKGAQKPQEKQAQRTHSAQGLPVCPECDWQLSPGMQLEHRARCPGKVARATADRLLTAFPGSTRDGFGDRHVGLRVLDGLCIVVHIHESGTCSIERFFGFYDRTPEQLIRLLSPEASTSHRSPTRTRSIEKRKARSGSVATTRRIPKP